MYCRAWRDPEVECEPSSNPFIILDEYDVSANLDKCCNNSWGRTARTFVWQTSLHGLKYLVYCRKHLLERFGWAIVCLLAAGLSLYLAIMAAKHFYEEPTRIHLKKVCTDLLPPINTNHQDHFSFLSYLQFTFTLNVYYQWLKLLAEETYIYILAITLYIHTNSLVRKNLPLTSSGSTSLLQS